MIRNRLKEFRELHGYSQRELARMAGVSEFTVVKLETIEGYTVSLSNAERICRVFNELALERMFWIDYSPEENPSTRQLEAVS